MQQFPLDNYEQNCDFFCFLIKSNKRKRGIFRFEIQYLINFSSVLLDH